MLRCSASFNALFLQNSMPDHIEVAWRLFFTSPLLQGLPKYALQCFKALLHTHIGAEGCPCCPLLLSLPPSRFGCCHLRAHKIFRGLGTTVLDLPIFGQGYIWATREFLHLPSKLGKNRPGQLTPIMGVQFGCHRRVHLAQPMMEFLAIQFLQLNFPINSSLH